jgi:DNA-binding MarR family transcriptional regulator
MNAVFFGLKRAFHGTLRLTRTALARLGLTAARFDMLYALPHRLPSGRRSRNGMRQSALRRQLGVSRPTVSRMLRSLEELGLVARERDSHDRRQIFVALTDAGRALIREAIQAFIRSGYIQLALDTALCSEPGAPERSLWHDGAACQIAKGTLDGLLTNVRREFGDIARLAYLWAPRRLRTGPRRLRVPPDH